MDAPNAPIQPGETTYGKLTPAPISTSTNVAPPAAARPLKPSEQWAQKHPKAMSAILIMMGLGFAYFFMIRPVQEGILTGHIEYSVKAVVLTPMLLIFGVVSLFAKPGQEWGRKLDAKGRATLSTGGWITLGVAVVIMGLTWWGWEAYLRSLGFVMH